MSVDPTLFSDHLELIRYWHNGDYWAVHMGNEQPPPGHVVKPANRWRVEHVRTVEDLRRVQAREAS